MENHTVLITLPETLYERVRMSAEASARPVEDVLSQFIATSYPLLADDLPSEMRSSLPVGCYSVMPTCGRLPKADLRKQNRSH